MTDCKACPPGRRRLTKCDSVISNPSCPKCGPGTYSSGENRATECSDCDDKCSLKNEEIVQVCSPTSNIVCECKQGYFMRSKYDEYCEKDQPCPPGFGVSVKGTSKSKTVCVECPHNSFSNESSFVQRCQRHTFCPNSVRFSGNITSDSICDTASASGQREVLPTYSVALLASFGVILLIVAAAVIVYKCWQQRRQQHSWSKNVDKRYDLKNDLSTNNNRELVNLQIKELNIAGSTKKLNTQCSISDDGFQDEIVPPPHVHDSGSVVSTSSHVDELVHSLSLVIPPNHPLLAQLPGALTTQDLSTLNTGYSPQEATYQHLRLWINKTSNLNHSEVLNTTAQRYSIHIPV